MHRLGRKLSSLLLIILLNLLYHGVESRNSSTRIVGGKPILVSKVPYMVSLRIGGAFACGGTLVSRLHVVTAAHCVYGVDPTSIVVVGGVTRLKSRGVRRRLSKIFLPSSFSMSSMNNDVAVLKLSSPMTGRNIKGTKLCNRSWRSGQLVRVSGWGYLNQSSVNVPNRLQTIIVPILAKKRCKRRYRGVARLTASMICAGVPGRRDSCSGDSGGPLMYKGRLCGIVSWGIGCARKKYPGVYTSIKKVRGFIRRSMKK